MSKKEDFKEFVRKNPSLIGYVKDDKMSWQKFYELWDLYGEKDKVWDDYRSTTNNTDGNSSKTNDTTDASATWTSILSSLKNINMDTVKKNIDGIQKAIGFFQGLNSKDGDRKDVYEPRPLYRKFED